MKSLIELYGVLSTEIESRCRTSAHNDGSASQTHRDLQTIVARTEHEGLSFLTISLPALCRDFERSLDRGSVTDDDFRGFSKIAKLPKFLGWAFRRVFDADTGLLLKEPDLEAISGIRQLLLMFSKIKVPCSPKRTEAAFRSYLEIEEAVENSTQRLGADPSLTDRLSAASRLLYGTILGFVERDLNEFRLVPAHGPGSTADRLLGNKKFDQRSWTERLEEFFPKELFLLPSPRFYSNLDSVNILRPREEMPVKVISVPKTLKTPRIIAMEPVCMQYTQQALKDELVRRIENDNSICDLIGFTDQIPNRSLAQRGSQTGSLATLDLSEASDRVSVVHVRALLRDHPDLCQAIMAVRSTHARVPLGSSEKIVELKKYASMGSALTFPLEAMVFLAVAMIGIAEARNTSVTPRLIREMRGYVRVYGDDIIVPVDCVRKVVETLELFGFKVNSNKSFWTGKFRESCGGDFYDGHDVSIVRVRKLISYRPENTEEFISTVDLRNRLYMHGYWGSAAWMDRKFLQSKVPWPVVSPTSSALSRHSILWYETHRMDPDLQSPRVRAFTIRTKIPKNRIDGMGALLKFFLKRSNEPFEKGHLEYSGRAKTVGTKLRSVRPY